MRASLHSLLPVSFAFLLAVAAPARAQSLGDVTLDDVAIKGKTGGTLTLKKVEIKGTNFTREEFQKLFDPESGKDVVLGLVTRLKAASLSIPDGALIDPEVNITLHGLAMSAIDAGKVGAFTLANFSGASKYEDGYVVMKSGAVEMRDVNLARLLLTASSGALEDVTMQVGSMSWRDFELTVPDKETPASAPGGNLIKVGIASISGENTYEGEIPIKSMGRGEHITFEMPKGSTGADQLAAFGVDRIDAGFAIAATYDKATRAFNLDDFSVNGAQLGAIGLRIAFGGIDSSIFNGNSNARIAAMMGGDIGSFSLRYGDAGLFAKALAYVAHDQDKQAEDVRAEWKAMATQFLPLILAGDPASLKIAAALGDFIANPGNLTLSAKAKSAPLKIMELMNLNDPKALLARVDLDAVASK